MNQRRDLLSRLAVGPRFLIVGQGGHRAPLEALRDQLRPCFPTELDDLVRAGNGSSPTPLFEALEQFSKGWTEGDSAVHEFPWNGVFTSRIDASASAAFEASWRRVVPTAVAETGRHPRSTTELQFRFLFGGLGLPVEEQPARDEVEFLDWQRRANDTLTTLATRLLTPRGLVAIDGWAEGDWLSAADLYNFAARLQSGQVHLFSSPSDPPDSKLLQVAIERGLLTVHNESLADVLAEVAELGLVGEFGQGIAGRSQKLLPVGASFVPIDTGVWNQILSSARPVNTELLEPFPEASSSLRYQRFRSFLGAAEGAPPWRAIASGLKVSRDFEAELLKRVRNLLQSREGDGPVVLHGQTASGKSLALTWMAQELARSGEVAVLHQSRRRERPNAADVEAFGTWVEARTGMRTVLLWDGMVDPDEYHTLQRQLRARGQRILVVGSSYLVESPGSDYVTAPIRLSQSEAERVTEWLAEHEIGSIEADAGSDTSFLALLYRALPETERGLRQGLGLEMRAAEAGMQALAKDKRGISNNRMTAIAQALMEAGFDTASLQPSDHPDGELSGIEFHDRSIAEQLSAVILTVGRHGLTVPLELALRLVGREGLNVVVDFVRRFDIYRWNEDENGDQFLGARTTLEAELLAREDLPISVEAEIISAVIRNVRASSSRSGGSEVQLVIDLLEQVGPQSPLVGKFGGWFGDFAEAFRDLRDGSGVTHHRLVLAEANLLREYVRRAQGRESLDQPQRLALLVEAENLLERTLEETDNSGRSALNLWVELAACLGAQVVESTKAVEGAQPERVTDLMKRLIAAALRARSIDPENAYPVDVIAWAARDAVQTGVLAPREKIDLLAEAQASLDSLDAAALSPKQQATYAGRQADIAKLLGDEELATQYLSDLMSNDDPSAYYLLASRTAAAGPEGLKVAVDTLLAAPQEVRRDWKCARLLLDLFWQERTGQRLLRGERQCVALPDSGWQECHEVAESLGSANGFDRYRAEFVRGLSLFHLGSIKASQMVFRDLGSLSLDLRTRIISAYLASDDQGTPVVYTGRVLTATPDGRRGRVWVDQLRAELDFIPMRFSQTEFRNRNEVLPPFHIAFNFRGPVVDAIRHTRG